MYAPGYDGKRGLLLSLDPMLLLACIATRLPTHDAIRQSRRFSVNVLPQGAARLAGASFCQAISIRQVRWRTYTSGVGPPSAERRFSRHSSAIYKNVCLAATIRFWCERWRACAGRSGSPLLFFRRKFGCFDDPKNDWPSKLLGLKCRAGSCHEVRELLAGGRKYICDGTRSLKPLRCANTG